MKVSNGKSKICFPTVQPMHRKSGCFFFFFCNDFTGVRSFQTLLVLEKLTHKKKTSRSFRDEELKVNSMLFDLVEEVRALGETFVWSRFKQVEGEVE